MDQAHDSVEFVARPTVRSHQIRAQAEKLRRTHIGVACLFGIYAIAGLVTVFLPDQHHDIVAGSVVIGTLLFVFVDGLVIRRWVRNVRVPPGPNR